MRIGGKESEPFYTGSIISELGEGMSRLTTEQLEQFNRDGRRQLEINAVG